MMRSSLLRLDNNLQQITHTFEYQAGYLKVKPEIHILCRAGNTPRPPLCLLYPFSAKPDSEKYSELLRYLIRS